MIFISVVLLLVFPSFSITQEIPTFEASKNPGGSEPDFEIPEYILPCNRSDPELNKCFLRACQHLKPYINRGIPELGIPPFEPLRMSLLRVDALEGPVRGSAIYTNITTVGAGNHTVEKVKFDLNTMRLDLHITIPKLEIEGHYLVEANILLLPLESEGDFFAVFGDIKAVARVRGVEELRDGVRYMRIEELLIDFTVGNATFTLEDPSAFYVTNRFINGFLNRYALRIIEAVTPATSDSLAEFFLPILDAAYSKMPLKVWLPDA